MLIKTDSDYKGMNFKILNFTQEFLNFNKIK